ncbi:DUF1631 family protein [Rubrivivax gelatinosus]|uniref:Thymidine phosphorylase n=1 Tax=Rubrivivax gelatinosus TaxID=28068 RepID=A0ABS1DRD4_RUBGE|nr:DUF1631 family protein [Rubrivivax gelatinosus]MBK1712521.1 hypothetical protein [Rubrivivax gelatinosus]
MSPSPVHRLPAALEGAVQHVKLAARQATERTIESLGLAALASNNAFQRDGLLGAQFELNRKSAVFALAFNEAYERRMLREVAPRSSEDSTQSPGWESLRLVEDREVEIEVAAERFGMETAHACEWELRELGAYVGALLGNTRGEHERNPLRPELVGLAMFQAIETVSERAEVRAALGRELARTFATVLRTTYTDIVADLRRAGAQPAGLTVRHAESRSGATGPGFATSERGAEAERSGWSPEPDSRWGSRRGGSSSFGPATRSGTGRGTPLGEVDPAMMALMRRIAYAEGSAMAGETADAGPASALPNLIHAHRDELRQAAAGSLDLMVIDVIGSLFDQILSDPKVPPQVARQIGRLQLPVLRAALGDPSFFSSRRHPVRRFVNRIASLGTAFEDIGEDGAQRLLAKVRELVDEVVQGDFDQLEIYQSKLAALEAFVAEQGRAEVRANGDAAELLAAKEDELRLRQLYAQQLQGELKDLAAPQFLRDFISQIWSQVVVAASERDGADAESVRQLRQVGRELFMSVQAKTSSAQRKSFLAELPRLMKDLGAGLDLIRWPEASRREFFGQLLPAHAESLKAQPLRPLDFNLLAREVDGALQRPLPTRDELRAAPANLPVLDEVIAEPQFSAEEATRIGLVDETQVDWNGQIDIVVGEDTPLAAADTTIGGLPAPAEPVEPSEGRGLAEHVQVGFAYRMHIGDAWQKVRLVHVSPGRSFFVFHHGARHKETISLTQRMLVRLCEAGRLRAFENAWLLERATARARRQLASVRGGANA